MKVRESIIENLEKSIMFKYLELPEDEEYDIEFHENQVIQELQYHIGNNQYSKLFLQQLTQLHGAKYVEIRNKKHPYQLSPIYWMLEKIIKNEIPFKEFKRKKSLLYGKNVYHVHHSQSFYIEDNHIRYFKQKYKTEESLTDRIAELLSKNPDCNPVFEIVYECLMESMTWIDKTGEWILFQNKNGLYYFLALGIHDANDKEDKKLYDEIIEYVQN